MIKQGHLVEFTDEGQQNYPPADRNIIRFGVCVEDAELGSPVRVQVGSGEIVEALHIHAFGWSGWCPEELEQLLPDDEYTGNWDSF